MSYREQRNISEIARALGYPRILSIENFRVPNFKLVAEILEWIVKRFEPGALISADCQNEQERVLFVKTAVLTLIQTARIRLNPKKIYMADGHAVQELLIPMKILYQATREQPAEELTAQWNAMKSKLNSKMQEVRICRQLASQLPQTGSVLNDLLGKDIYYRKERTKATSRTISIQEAEKTVNEFIASLTQETKDIQDKLANISNDETALDEKIERRKREYEQLQKRYAKLQSFRPAHMDEYEKYETKLKEMYEVYVLKFRNLAYLQQQYGDLERAEGQRMVEAERNMRIVVEKMRNEQKESAIVEELMEEKHEEEERRGPRRVFGNMVGAGLSDEEDEEEEGEEDDRPRMEEESDEEHVLSRHYDEKASSGDEF